MIPRSVEIGPFILHLYGLIIAASIYLGWFLARKRAAAYKIPRHFFDDPILIIPLILGIAGARLYHVVDYWNIYSHDLISILFINRGGLAIWGGILGAAIGFLIVAKIKKLEALTVLDLAAPSLLLGQAIGRVANFVNQEGFGPPTTLPWAVYIEPPNRPPQFSNFAHFHPTFFYEAILNLIFFLLLLYFAKNLKGRGQAFALYLIFYSIARFITEFWRIDTAVLVEVKVAHIISIFAFTIGLLLFSTRKRRG
ncbi:prolipoprotein diacylglyceryl transferase [Candidatus Curtissbacteria bacterium]|nr:prolipoprotein diacylglyceryl transferase [Candidatus Curtissbacteria bacterium]